MQKKSTANLIGSIDELLNRVAASEKTASKKAEANTEAGGYMGQTTHPTKSVDDSTDAASEGARSSENTEDAKNEPNRGQPVDAVSESRSVDQNSVQMDIGITSKATGEDSAAETDSAKAGKDDPGSSHPARTDNDSLDGNKFSSDRELELYVEKLRKQAEDAASALCAAIAVHVQEPKKASAPAAKKPEPAAPAKTAQDTAVAAAEAGYDLAGLFANTDVSTQDKQAADAFVVDTLAEIMATATRRAQKCAEFYTARFAEMAKQSNDGMPAPAGPPGPGDEAAEAGGAPGAEGGGGGQITPEEEAMLMQLLQQQGGGEGGGMGGDIGGDAAMAGMMGGAPGAGGHGEPDADQGGAPSDGDADNVDPAMLEQVLADLGVSPEQVAQKAAAKKAAAKPKWQPKSAADVKRYNAMKSYISELNR